jgi:hypothetical protein
MKRLLVATAIAGCGVAFARDARAYRPFDGTDADVAPLGEFELELGPAHYYATERTSYVIAPATVLNLGILPRVELVVDFKNFVAIHPIPDEERVRLLDTDVFLKWNYRPGILQGKSGLSMAVEAGPLTPNIHGEDGFGASALFIESYRWPATTIHVNTQLQYTREHDIDLFQSVIVEGPSESPVRPIAEVFVDHAFGQSVFFERNNAPSTAYSALVGAIWEARDGLAFDMAIREAYENDMRATEVRLGFTWAIELWGGGHDETQGRNRRWRRFFARR